MEMPALRLGLPLGSRTAHNPSDAPLRDVAQPPRDTANIPHKSSLKTRLNPLADFVALLMLCAALGAMWCTSLCSQAHADSAPPISPLISADPATLRCVPGTGIWRTAYDVDGKPTTELAAALCATSDAGLACPDLATLRFRDNQPAHALIAETPANLKRCDLQWQGSLDGLALYHDGQDLLGVDPNRLRFVTLNPLPFKTTPAERFTQTDRPGGLIVFSNPERMVLLKTASGGKPLPKAEVVLDLDLKGLLIPPLWQPKRLILLWPDRLRWWSLDAQGHPAGKPQEHAVTPTLGPNDFGFDLNGMITAYRRQGASSAVAWYPFNGSERTAVGLNTTEIVRRVGAEGTPDTTVVLTTDGPQADLMAPWGVTIKRPQDRFMHRYWRPVEETFSGDGGRPGPTVMGAGPWIAVDGSPPPPMARSRVLIVNTSTDTWERTAEFDLDTPGRFVAMTPDYLVTFHPTGDQALMVWRLSAKGLLRAVSRADYDAANLQGLPTFERIRDDLYRLTDAHGHIALFDAASASFKSLLPPLIPNATPRLSPMFSNQILVEEIHGDPSKVDKTAWVARWHIIDPLGAHRAFDPSAFLSEAFSATTRWFGYCPPAPAGQVAACALTFPTFSRAAGNDDHLLSLLESSPPASRPLETSLALIGATAFLLLLITAWRLDWGRRAHAESVSTENPPPELILVDAEIDGQLRTVSLPTPDDPSAIPISSGRGLLIVNRDGIRLQLPGQPDIHLPIDADLDLALTRQIDFANHTPGGLLTLTFFSNKNNQRQELAFDVQLPPTVRPFEHIAYRNFLHAPRTTWDAIEPLLELLKRHPNMQQILYRKLTRQARPAEALAREPSGLIDVAHLVDPKGRRYVTDDDWTAFIRPSTWQIWPLRLLLACGAGAAAALPLMMIHIGVEDAQTLSVITLSLAFPVAAALWLITSWGVWNRLHLLKFGRAIQGQWLDEKTLQFTLIDGRTFRLSRSLWENQDLLPVILCDPRRPRFAVHFTGHRNIGQPQSSSPVGAMRRAWSSNLLRLLPPLAAFGLIFAFAFRTFQAVFPEPLPSARLEAIAEEATQSGEPMLPSCMQTCQEFKTPARRATCETQCTHRQTRIAFLPLRPLPHDISTDPGLLIETQFKAFDDGLRALNPPQPAPSCDAIAPLLEGIPRWTPRLQEILGKTYGSARMMATSPAFEAFNRRIAALADSSIKPLCNPTQACLSDPDNHCPSPPPCTGSVDKLREALCTLAPAISPITSPAKAPTLAPN